MLQEILTHTPDGDIAGYRIPTAQTPRARLIALHGGGYWHDEQNPGGSLLLLGAALGFEVIAIDRPGSADRARAGLTAFRSPRRRLSSAPAPWRIQGRQFF